MNRHTADLSVSDDIFSRLTSFKGTTATGITFPQANRAQGELQLERTKVSALELQLEERRRELEMIEAQLAAKREKKRKWKAAERESLAVFYSVKGSYASPIL